MRNSTIAIVIGIGSYNDLGLIRSCGEKGIGVIYITPFGTQPIPIHKSRYVIKTIFNDITEQNVLDNIKGVCANFKGQKIVVFPASDNAVEILDKNCSLFPSNVFVSHAFGNVKTMMDKEVMANMADRAGLITPRTVVVNKTDMLKIREKCRSIAFPLIIKPVKSIDGSKSDIKVCNDFDELTDTLENLFTKNYECLLVQEYINSHSSKEIGITGISYMNGDIEIHGVIEKYRNRSNINNFGKYFPKRLVECETALKKYIASTHYVGIFDTDFIYNAGKFYFIECNFRNGAYGYAVTHSGFNMPFWWISSIEMNHLRKKLNLKPTVFMEERTDFLNVLDHTISPFEWMKDIVITDTFLWWNWKDPRPMLRIPHFIKKPFVKL